MNIGTLQILSLLKPLLGISQWAAYFLAVSSISLMALFSSTAASYISKKVLNIPKKASGVVFCGSCCY
jgi:hypothetical protein